MVNAKFTHRSRWVPQVLGLLAAALVVAILIIHSDGLLTESQLIRSGVESSAATSFAVPLASGPATHSLDSLTWGAHAPVLVVPGKRISVLAGSTVTVNGWAYDSQVNAPFAAIGGKVDGAPQTVSAVVHLARPDVAAALRTSNARNSGFALNIDTTDLPMGRHVIRLRALSPDRQTAYELGPAINIDVADRRAATQRTDSIDALNGVIINSASSEAAPIGVLRSVGRLTVSGWGFVTEGQHLASSVTMLVDGEPAGTARYGTSRPDVARAYHDVRFTRSGFEGSLQTDSLTPGPHEIRFRIGLSDGTSIPSFSTIHVNLL